MKKIVLLSVCGISLAVAGGVGLSTAHTFGLFAPAPTDWLTTSRMVTPDAPATDLPVTVDTPTAIPVAAPAPLVSVPLLENPQPAQVVQTFAPLMTSPPPVRSAPAAAVQTAQTPVPQIAPQPTVTTSPRLSTRQAPAQINRMGPQTPQDLTSQPRTQGPAAIDRVWLLGVYR